MKIDVRALRAHAKKAWAEALKKPEGSLNDLMQRVSQAVKKEFKRPTDEYGPWVAATYPDKVVFEYPNDTDYVEVAWSEDAKGNITFGEPKKVRRREIFEPIEESIKRGEIQLEEPKRFVETTQTTFEIVESDGKGFRVRGTGIETDTVNENNRRYRKDNVVRALNRLSESLNESAGQGRALTIVPGQLLGEADHPTDKGNTRPLLSETVVKWEKVTLPDRRVILEGVVVPTAKGKDVQALIEAGVPIGISQRAYGESSVVTEGGQTFEDIEDITITGYDLVLEPASAILDVAKVESIQPKEETSVTLEELLKQHPELKESIDSMSKAQVEKLLAEKAAENKAQEDKAIREALGLKDDEPITEAVLRLAADNKKIEEAKTKEALAKHIDEACKELPYGGDLNKQFVEAVKAGAKTKEEADALIESRRKEYDAIVAKARLESKGFGAKVIGSVLEKETGTPEFARSSHALCEAIGKRRLLESPRGLKVIKTEKDLAEHVAGGFIGSVLERFDEKYRHALLAESKLLEEAETTADLNLPYSVSRTIIREAMPRLVALSIFDVQTTDQAPTRLYFEQYANEAGVANTIVDEVVTFVAIVGVEQPLAHGDINAGSVVVTNTGATVTYIEDTDYVVDYGRGKIRRITTGAITEAQAVKVDYTYKAVRKGENVGIERGKQAYSYKTLDIAADRLASDITKETIVFARSQLGEDAQARAIAGVITQIQQVIDKRLFDIAKYATKTVSNNLAGTWSTTAPAGVKWDDHLKTLVQYLGVAKTKVSNRYYDPTFHLLSVTTGDMLSNCSTFTAAGQRPDADLNAAGYIGRLKGLPVFATTQFDDAHILTGHRELVQHRVFEAMILKGPYPTYDVSGKLVASDQYYTEEFNGTDSPVPEKGSYTKIS